MGFPGLGLTGGFAVSAADRLPHQLYLYRSDELFPTVIPHELAHLLLEVTLNKSPTGSFSPDSPKGWSAS